MILCVLGSGGHTSELLTIIQDIKSEFIFVASSNDTLSIVKAKQKYPNCKIYTVIRPRLPAQPLIFAIPRIMASVIHTFIIIMQIYFTNSIKVVIGNGPGICVLIFFIFRILCVQTVYVESFARVKSLSLTGKIVKKYCNHFIVQWQENEGIHMEWIV